MIPIQRSRSIYRALSSAHHISSLPPRQACVGLRLRLSPRNLPLSGPRFLFLPLLHMGTAKIHSGRMACSPPCAGRPVPPALALNVAYTLVARAARDQLMPRIPGSRNGEYRCKEGESCPTFLVSMPEICCLLCGPEMGWLPRHRLTPHS